MVARVGPGIPSSLEFYWHGEQKIDNKQDRKGRCKT